MYVMRRFDFLNLFNWIFSFCRWARVNLMHLLVCCYDVTPKVVRINSGHASIQITHTQIIQQMISPFYLHIWICFVNPVNGEIFFNINDNNLLRGLYCKCQLMKEIFFCFIWKCDTFFCACLFLNFMTNLTNNWCTIKYNNENVTLRKWGKNLPCQKIRVVHMWYCSFGRAEFVEFPPLVHRLCYSFCFSYSTKCRSPNYRNSFCFRFYSLFCFYYLGFICSHRMGLDFDYCPFFFWCVCLMWTVCMN